MYKVYKIEPRMYYQGFSLVAAESVAEANEFIDSFIKKDVCDCEDSSGCSYVNELDMIVGISSKNKGIVFHGIYFYGS